MYVSPTVGIAELGRNLSVYLLRFANGERLIVTDRNRPIAELGPLTAAARLAGLRTARPGSGDES